ncbi:MAG: hypothetical protein CML66_02280 [Rhodobacteraceae bacterium]|nr:hypothetical protein [Paracoccaceae bacterium]MAY46053.1 hypothetical protein [Paracoccaceae bacterium]
MADSVHYQKRIVTHVLVATFIGLHVPLTCMVLYALLTGFQGLVPVLLLAFVATLCATAATLLYIRARLMPGGKTLTA